MIRLADLHIDLVNSLTKYPSIPTFHPMENGRLTEGAPVALSGSVLVTEKVDGTNARIILDACGGYIIGSRESLLHSRGDRLFDPAMGIAVALRPLAERAVQGDAVGSSGLLVLFGELYGHKIGAAAKHYTSGDAVGFRLFDAIRLHEVDVRGKVPYDAATLSAWREHGGQPFVDEDALQGLAASLDLPTTPRVGELPADCLPRTLDDAARWLAQWPETTVALDGAAGPAEGVVIRDRSRRAIAKLRFEDYRKALRPRK